MRLLRLYICTSFLFLASHSIAQSDSTNRSTQFQSEIPDHSAKPSNTSEKRTYRYGDRPANVNAETCGYALRSELVTFVNWKISSDNHSGKYRIERVSMNSIPWDSTDYDLVRCLDTLFARADIKYLQNQVECYLHHEFLWRRKDFKELKVIRPKHRSKIKGGEEYWAYSVPLFLADQAYVILKSAYQCREELCTMQKVSLFKRTKDSWTEVRELQRLEGESGNQ